MSRNTIRYYSINPYPTNLRGYKPRSYSEYIIGLIRRYGAIQEDGGLREELSEEELEIFRCVEYPESNKDGFRMAVGRLLSRGLLALREEVKAVKTKYNEMKQQKERSKITSIKSDILSNLKKWQKIQGKL